MGFEIMIEIEAGGTSSKVSQFDEDGKLASHRQRQRCRHRASRRHRRSVVQPANVDAYFGDARRVAWWIEHEDLGRLTVGR